MRGTGTGTAQGAPRRSWPAGHGRSLWPQAPPRAAAAMKRQMWTLLPAAAAGATSHPGQTATRTSRTAAMRLLPRACSAAPSAAARAAVTLAGPLRFPCAARAAPLTAQRCRRAAAGKPATLPRLRAIRLDVVAAATKARPAGGGMQQAQAQELPRAVMRRMPGASPRLPGPPRGRQHTMAGLRALRHRGLIPAVQRGGAATPAAGLAMRPLAARQERRALTAPALTGGWPVPRGALVMTPRKETGGAVGKGARDAWPSQEMPMSAPAGNPAAAPAHPSRPGSGSGPPRTAGSDSGSSHRRIDAPVPRRMRPAGPAARPLPSHRPGRPRRARTAPRT